MATKTRPHILLLPIKVIIDIFQLLQIKAFITAHIFVTFAAATFQLVFHEVAQRNDLKCYTFIFLNSLLSFCNNLAQKRCPPRP